MKVKFANKIFEVLYTKNVAEQTMYAVEDEPNHIDWLVNVEVVNAEKQGEQKSQGKSALEVWKDMRLEIYQQASSNRHESNCSDDSTKMFSLTDIDEIFEIVAEKQGNDSVVTNVLTNKIEQNINNEIEKGNWYVCTNSRYKDFVVGKAYYCPKNGMLKPNENEMTRYVAKHCFRIWTIEDAKDGDILYISSTASHEIFIFKGLSEEGYIKCYCSYDSEDGYCNGEYHFIGKPNFTLHPANIEQGELLFSNMNKAGYVWDAEQKELKQIKQNTACSEKYIADIFEKVGLAKIVREQANDKLTCALQDAMLELSKSTPITDNWVEDYWKHNKVNNPDSYDGGDEIQFDHDGFVRFCKMYCKKSAWSENDEQILEIITSVLRANFNPKERFSGYEEYMTADLINWLNSLEERQFKPTDEQIIALRWVLTNIPYCRHKEELSGLLNQIKNL